MAEISFNSIFDGVTLALHRAFPTVKIHGKTVKQDLHPGDFTVLPIKPQHSGQMSTRAKRDLTLDVIYHPAVIGCREECLGIADKLPRVLGTITTPQDDKVHGTGMECNIEDDALHCIVSYPHFVYEPADGDAMETLTMK